ncbi:MAG: D-alanyl-D-alanine carboxypeptidase [Ruminococcaceae bacterium]|nr:D-alanyl-D-alanine carboxypeptidase [Oscillospiraceae bacterium]
MLKKRIFSIALVLVLLFSVSASAFDLNSQGAISMNFETGEVYYEKNADTLLTPASLTKIMTLYILFEKMESGEISEDTLIPISQNAATLSRNRGATNVPLTSGGSISVRQLIDAITVVSACGCCTVVAEYISGSEAEFAKLMTQTAKELGIDARFYDASGLSDDNLISPRGLAMLVQTFIKKHPEILTYTKKTSVVFSGKTYDATNMLLPVKNTRFYYPGADGFKTGTTSKAGKCLVSTAIQEDARVLCVVMKAQTNDYRYIDSRKLLDDAFRHAAYLEKNLFATDIKAYINNLEIPCTYKMFGAQGIMVMADDLVGYGFDIRYDENTQTIYIEENDKKEISPIQSQKLPLWEKELKITKSPIKAVLIKDSVEIELANIVSTDKGCAIGFGELSAHYTKIWDNEQRTAHLNTK